MRKKNPWIEKKGFSLGNFDFSSTASIIIMSYGFYCLFGWAAKTVKGFGLPKHG